MLEPTGCSSKAENAEEGTRDLFATWRNGAPECPVRVSSGTPNSRSASQMANLIMSYGMARRAADIPHLPRISGMIRRGNRQDFERVAFIDLEASGLGSASFPTEVGWTFVREDMSIESGSCLIRPVARWTRHANAWSAAAEALTGITREMLDRDGLPPGEAVA
jgi:hypothetical protein